MQTSARRRHNPGGEFMIINPRRRRHRRRRATRVRARRAVSHRRRRRNPYLPYAMNPRRRRHAGRRRRHRNPALFRGGSVLGIPLGEAASVTLGAVGTDILSGFVAKFVPLPAGMDPRISRVAVKAITVAAGSMLAGKMLGSRMARAFALGGGVSILLDVYAGWVKPMVPGLSDYVPERLGMGAYEPEFSLGALTGDATPNMWVPAYK